MAKTKETTTVPSPTPEPVHHLKELPPLRAQISRQFIQAPPVVENDNEVIDPPSPENQRAIQGRSPILTSSLTPAVVEEEKKETPPTLILGKFKSQDDLVKSYQEVEKLATRLATKNRELDVALAGKTTPPAPRKVEVPKDLGDLLYSDPQKALEKLAEIFGPMGTATAVPAPAPAGITQDEGQKIEAWFAKEHADLYQVTQPDGSVVKNPDVLRLIDGLTALHTGTASERYEKAVEEYRRAFGAEKARIAQETTEQIAAQQRMKASADLPPGGKAPGQGKKIWKQSTIDRLITEAPMEYQKHQNEILAALRENRVRLDL